jgi:hypothetical protein
MEIALATALVEAGFEEPETTFPEALTLLDAAIEDAHVGDLRSTALERLAYVATLLGKDDVAQKAHLALVCPGGVDGSQDHPKSYWRAWEGAHQLPLPRERAARDKARRAFHALPDGPRTFDEETSYRTPFHGCLNAYPESWYAIARLQLRSSPTGLPEDDGPFYLARAVDALRRAIAASDADPERGARSPTPGAPYFRLLLARILFDTQRYGAASRELVALLGTPEVPADVAARAKQLLGCALTEYDLDDPPESDPDITRPEIFDTEVSPRSLDIKLRGVLDRLSNPAYLPQDRAWTPDVVRWAARELLNFSIFDSTVFTTSLFLAHWPLHRDVPRVVQIELEADNQRVLASLSKHRADALAQIAALKPRVLALFDQASAWTAANRGDADAMRAAKALVDAFQSP